MKINDVTFEQRNQTVNLISTPDENFMRSSFYNCSDAGSSNGFTNWKKKKNQAAAAANKPS